MKHTFALAAAFVAFASAALAADLNLVPYPQEVKMGEGTVPFEYKLGGDGAFHSTRDFTLPDEGYKLSISKEKGIEIRYKDDEGRTYAIFTLCQLAGVSGMNPDGRTLQVPCCEITDWPAFKWRGVLFDDCRHFFGKESVKKTLVAMFRHKMNVFHWHLTEDQAWRLAIPKYPDLIKYGAVRPESQNPDGLGLPKMDGTPYGPYYYTEDDVKEVLAFARMLNIRVIPEIEIPGHALAAIAAYPQFCCRGRIEPRMPWCQWGISEDIICAGNDEAIEFLEDVLDYVTDLFPDAVVHIGGDEAPKTRWKECPKCQARIKALGLKDETALQGWVTKHFTEYLAKKGRRAIGWDEITECDLPAETMVMVWRGAQAGAAAAKKGHDVVMCPTSHCYLDYPQSRDHHAEKAKGYGWPHWAPPLTLEMVYSFDPLAGIPAECRSHILGIQGNTWSEHMRTPAEHEWKLWPRAAALAEIGWTGPGRRTFDDFKRRCDIDMEEMEKAGYNVCR